MNSQVSYMWGTGVDGSSALSTLNGSRMSGRYRSCRLRRHWTQESGACHLPGCGQIPGDVAHLLSGECLALQNMFDMLASHPHLLPPVLTALNGDRDTTTMFFLDPSKDPAVMKLVQEYGHVTVLAPLFQAARAWVWCAHRARMRLLGLEWYLQ